MTDVAASDFRLPRRYVRLDTILRLRWLAALGQLAAIFIVAQGLEFDVPIVPCVAVVGLSAAVNLALQIAFNPMQRLDPIYAAALLALNIVELAALLFLTGGLQNPFSFLFLAPVLISATALPIRLTIALGVLAVACASAHELGTPLSTIFLIARELEKSVQDNDHLSADLKTLREQAQRCRDILAKITQLSSSGAPFDRMPLSTLIEETVAPHRDFGVAIKVRLAVAATREPVGARNPAILYGVGNILENAVDFARTTVEVNAWWNADTVEIVISDEGPGIAPDMLKRIGEPYLSRRRSADEAQSGHSGLGLGVFIARTLLERTGAKVSFTNRTFPDHGAVVQIAWPRERFEAEETPAGPAD